jgi:tetratricopeptide (TPR) repeat protein
MFYNQTKYKEACKAAMEALKKFKFVIRKLHVKETKEESEALRAIGLYNAINRTGKFLDKLEFLLVKANETIVELGLNYSLIPIEEGIKEAREHLLNATSLLEEGKVDEAAKEIGKAHHVVAGYMGILHPIVNAHKVKRAEKFVNKTISRLEKLKSRLNNLLINASPVAKMAVTLAIQKAHDHILKVKKMLTGLPVKRFNLLVNELLNVKKEEEVALSLFSKEKPKVAHLFRDVEKTEKEIQALQSSLISLGINASNLNLTIQEAKNLLSQAMVFLGEGKKEEAKKLIEQAKKKDG